MKKERKRDTVKRERERESEKRAIVLRRLSPITKFKPHFFMIV